MVLSPDTDADTDEERVLVVEFTPVEGEPWFEATGDGVESDAPLSRFRNTLIPSLAVEQ